MNTNTVYIQDDFNADQAIAEALAIICGQTIESENKSEED